MPSTKKEIWQLDTEKLASQIREAAKGNPTEEELKMRVEPLLRKVFKNMEIDIDLVGYEKTSALRGRADTVYGYLIIEYKRPGRLSGEAGRNEALRELQIYLRGESKGQPSSEAFLEKAVGVAIDGEQVFFVRFTRSERLLMMPLPIPPSQEALFPELPVATGFQVMGPYPVSKESLANLLLFARATARRPLTALDLSQVFGPESKVARRAIAELYSALNRGQRPSSPTRVKAFFREWDRIFGVVYGQELEKAEKAAEETATLYQMPTGVRLKYLLFSIHTYFAFLMKLIAIELLSMQKESTVASFIQGLGAVDDKTFRDRLSDLESGRDFTNKGIANFLEADFFSWYLDEWAPALSGAMRDIVRALSEFESATPVLEPEWTRDLLQKLYELIVPRNLRHDLGEYYTPDWLAGYLIEKGGYTGDPAVRFLDPACGSGTFLVQAIHRVITQMESKKKIEMENIAGAILKNIVGFDLNPLAVLAARTNYLIAFSRLIPYVRTLPFSIPVYLCDSVVPPSTELKDGELPLENTVIFRTTKGDYTFPLSVKGKESIDRFTGLVDTGLRGKLDLKAFEKLLKKDMNLKEIDQALLVKIYEKIKALDDAGENGIWAKYIKNAFAPVYVGQFDFVVGNPPWIRWGYLSDEYRKRTLSLWHRYGLFSLKGHETRLGAGEKDFSMLFTYACADRYVKDKGILAFLITLEVFKSKGAGEGFRGFMLKDTGIPLKVILMEDLVHLMPFQAANKTSFFVLKKGEATTYPVPIIQWTRKKGIGRIPPEWPLEKVLSSTDRIEMKAIPVDPNRPVSSWQTASSPALRTTKQMKGVNTYKAVIGIRAEPYGVFWLRLKEVRPDKKIIIENMYDRGKRKISSVTTVIESDIVYPAVSGGDINRFGICSYFYVLISQDPRKREGYDTDWLSTNLPLTYGYLTQFKNVLTNRAAYKKYYYKDVKVKGEFVKKEAIAPYWSMYNISESSFSPYRVTWKRMASRMTAVVLSKIKTKVGIKPVISTDTTSFIAVDDHRAAHYLCGILNSSIVDSFIKSFSSAGRGFGAPSVMNNLAIPRFALRNPIHKKLADLSEEAHRLVAAGKDVSQLDREIDETVKKLWNIKS